LLIFWNIEIQTLKKYWKKYLSIRFKLFVRTEKDITFAAAFEAEFIKEIENWLRFWERVLIYQGGVSEI